MTSRESCRAGAPAVQILLKRLRKEHLISYDLHFLTGNYPEGNALIDLFIHPLDLVTFLFGKPEIIACQPTLRIGLTMIPPLMMDSSLDAPLSVSE